MNLEGQVSTTADLWSKLPPDRLSLVIFESTSVAKSIAEAGRGFGLVFDEFVVPDHTPEEIGLDVIEQHTAICAFVGGAYLNSCTKRDFNNDWCDLLSSYSYQFLPENQRTEQGGGGQAATPSESA